MFKCKNNEFELGNKTYIMGILNVTDDSFFDGGKYNTKEKALVRSGEQREESRQGGAQRTTVKLLRHCFRKDV